MDEQHVPDVAAEALPRQIAEVGAGLAQVLDVDLGDRGASRGVCLRLGRRDPPLLVVDAHLRHALAHRGDGRIRAVALLARVGASEYTRSQSTKPVAGMERLASDATRRRVASNPS